MKHEKRIADRILMVLSIIGIALFMFYWLKESYGREEKALDIKTSSLFDQTIRNLQVKKLKLSGIAADSLPSLHFNKVIRNIGKADSVVVSMPSKKGIVSTINVLQRKLAGTHKKDSGGILIAINETTVRGDSLPSPDSFLKSNSIVKFLYNIDSLQDTLTIQEIDSNFRLQLNKEKISLPFSVVHSSKTGKAADLPDNAITIGFAKPVTYELQLGNTMPFLLKKISLPIIFCLLLFGITILAFVMLYRNLVRQQRLGEIRNEFISNISHELKTPVATVGVAIEALKNFNAMHDPQRTREYLDISTNELQRLGLLIDKVLKLSMFEKKEMDLHYEDINLKEITEEVLLSLKLQFEKQQATVNLIANGQLDMQGDRLHLQSVIFNMLDNALKYANEKPVVDIELTDKDEEIILAVKDNGIGIPPEYQNKIFEKFFRVPHGNTHNAKGYGLGLSYVSQVIKKHGGNIEVRSKPANGTTFIIQLPKHLS